MSKHTDTSRIADLRFQVSEKMPINHSDLSCLFDRIEALEARVAELEDVAGDLLTRFEPWSPHDHDAAKRARAVLGDEQ